MEPHSESAQLRSGHWEDAFNRNKQLAKDDNHGMGYDVAFFGSSAVEHLLGTDWGIARPDLHNDTAQVFSTLFGDRGGDGSSSSGGVGTGYRGIPMGMNEDRCAETLYRMKNGELPRSLLTKTRVIWLVVGNTDINDSCAARTITTCMMQMAEFVRGQLSPKDHTKIVINSMFPFYAPNNRSLLLNPTWHKIEKIDRELECYAEQFDNVHFVNTTESFLDVTGEHVPANVMMPGMFHVPSAVGTRQWLVKIVKELDALLA